MVRLSMAQVHLQTRLSIQRMFCVSLSCDPTSYLLLLSLCTKHNYLLRLVELKTKSSLLGDDDKVLPKTSKKMKDRALVDIFDEK